MTFSTYFIRPGTVALVQVNAGMLPMGYNLLCSLRRINAHLLAEKIIFWSVDKKAVELLQSYRDKNNLSFGIYYPDNRHQYRMLQSRGSDGYNRLMRDRPSTYLILLRKYRLSFLFMDADIVFTNDPLINLFHNEDRGQPEDAIYSTDARNFYSRLSDPFEGQPFVPKICGGFFLLRPTDPTIRLLEDLNKAMHVDLLSNDQYTTDRLLNSRYNLTGNTFVNDPTRTWLVEPLPSGLQRRNMSVRTNSSLKVRLLDQAAYINGHIYSSLHDQYWNETFQNEKRNPFFQRIMIHLNTWVEDKLKLMERNGLWLLGSDGACILQ